MTQLYIKGIGMMIGMIFGAGIFALGKPERIRELLNVPGGVSLDGWRWKQISLPAQSLNKLLTDLEAKVAKDGWEAVISRYGSVRGMIDLAAEYDDFNLGSLYSALGKPEKLRELLNIGEDVSLADW